MPSYIVKAAPDEDLYVEWSTVVDAPIRWGTSDALVLRRDRKSRADATGTSSFDGFYNWEQESFLVANLGDGHFYRLPRHNLRVFLETLSAAPEEQETQQAALDQHATKWEPEA
jgi:hypothetical protein